MTNNPVLRPFRIDIPDGDLADLRDRLARARLPEQPPGTSWERGMPRDYLDALVRHWRLEYDWRAEEARLNAHPQFTTDIDGQSIHFVHVRSREPKALPLVLLHGYPGSIVDFVGLIGPLTDPRAHGGEASDAFDVVIPSLPGFGFSSPVTEHSWDMKRASGAMAQLMERLGYERYGAHGYDIGAGIAGDLPKLAPQAVVGTHFSTDPHALAYLGMLAEPGEDASEDERAYVQRLRADAEDGTGYLRMSSTRPQTLAYALSDSPIFQLAWIVEKLKEWSHPSKALPDDAVPRDTILTNVCVYWFTRTGASAAHFLYDSARAPQDWSPGPPIPTGFSLFGGDPFGVVRRVLNPGDANPHWVEHDRGGHFSALEEPSLVVDDLRAFFRGLRK